MSGRAVTVRMYRRILGDCFLLTIADKPDAARNQRSHILIDCGVLQGVAGAPAMMRDEIVADIEKATEGRLDCVIVTHEHYDHISGFKHAREYFEDKRIEIGCLWLAWTEDPRDPKGIELQQRFSAAHQKLAALQVARFNLGLDTPPADAVDENSKRVLGLAGFNAPLEDKSLNDLAADGAVRGSKAILRDLRKWAKASPDRDDKAEKVAYLSPGDVLDTPGGKGAPRIRAYVLGPPRTDEHLFKALPTKGAAKETYLLGVDVEQGGDQAGEHSPFAPQFRRPKPAAAKATALCPSGLAEFVKRYYDDDKLECRYAPLERELEERWKRLTPAEQEQAAAKAGAKDKPLDKPWLEDWLRNHRCKFDFVCGHRQDYRRIEDLLDVEQSGLALKMDNNTNNSSLVLAFAPGDRQQSEDDPADTPVLLFAADAQVGNWQSWETVEFWEKGHERNEPLRVRVTTAQLLARAKLYKVGHHGSHNATMKAKGLELMVDPDLVAMIPTVEDIALEQGKKGWQMPNPETYKGLIRQTKGRVLRGDRYWKKPDGKDERAGAGQCGYLNEQISKLIDEENKRIETERRNEPPIEFDKTFEPHRETELYVEYRIDY